MSIEKKYSFAFLVLMYNHENYIIEHLESIKYLVETHGAGWEVDLIVNDDCSQDKTRELVDHWLDINAKLFRDTKTIYNSKNLGTCKSVNNMLSEMKAERCKLTAGDDVYSYENIFENTRYEQDVAVVSGHALYLYEDGLSLRIVDKILAEATQVIYQDNLLLHRFKHLSYNNAPNLLYATECILHPRVREYLDRFEVIEDWPIQVAISREFPKKKFKLINKVFVYYRRTAGSTYIIANKRFVLDKIKVYDDLISKEHNWIEIIRIFNRKLCFKINCSIANRILNIDFYYFIFACIINSKEIFKKIKNHRIYLKKHIIHYNYIKKESQKILGNLI